MWSLSYINFFLVPTDNPRLQSRTYPSIFFKYTYVYIYKFCSHCFTKTGLYFISFLQFALFYQQYSMEIWYIALKHFFKWLHNTPLMWMPHNFFHIPLFAEWQAFIFFQCFATKNNAAINMSVHISLHTSTLISMI